ncbi:MAG: hypothetical protein OXH79_00045 [Boseongicola sp.]|nr:hypothetical protein [Boseongicola sp.]
MRRRSDLGRSGFRRAFALSRRLFAFRKDVADAARGDLVHTPDCKAEWLDRRLVRVDRRFAFTRPAPSAIQGWGSCRCGDGRDVNAAESAWRQGILTKKAEGLTASALEGLPARQGHLPQQPEA